MVILKNSGYSNVRIKLIARKMLFQQKLNYGGFYIIVKT